MASFLRKLSLDKYTTYMYVNVNEIIYQYAAQWSNI